MKSFFATIAGIDEQRSQEADDAVLFCERERIDLVLTGRARFRSGDEDKEVSAGSVLFVAAEVEHRFYDIVEELAVLVFFAPAES